MILKNINHDYGYHIQKIATMFFPLEKLRQDGEDNVIITTKKDDNMLYASVVAYSRRLEKETIVGKNDDERQKISVLLYDTLCELMGITLPWGILYGVRPARLMHATVESIGVEATVNKLLQDKVESKKIKLALDVMNSENKIIALSKPESYSLYVSIPFCPSRCSYCSFVSHSIEAAKDLIEPYVDLLCKELVETGKIAKKLNLHLETVYFGGGTPTTLSAKQLDKILSAVKENFDLSNLLEYTVEAGRPDTITKEKLEALKKHNVSRISINPQTFNDDVLKHIGRKHSAKQTVDSFKLARKIGFKNINMDFIAGLNTDTPQSFISSIDTAIKLNPESITVHNLSLKSGAYLCTESELFDLTKRNETKQMIDYSYDTLTKNGYNPYYMYRQSKSLGNFENVGYAKSGFECKYNVFMMDETHTVLAVGAGAVTKLVNPDSMHIERIYNYKYPYEYISGFNEIINRKQGIIDFYNA